MALGVAVRAPRSFVSRFLLPLVRGGSVDVGRPLGPRAVDDLQATWAGWEHVDFGDDAELPADPAALMLPPVRTTGSPRGPADATPSAVEEEAALAVESMRGAVARSLVPGLGKPPLDEVTLRLGVALHNLLALTHPALQQPDGRAARIREKTLSFTMEVARIGPPPTLALCVFRHTLLARVSEIVRPEHAVGYWLGRRTYVGKEPPHSLLRWQTWRRVTLHTTRRRWLSDIGVPVGARPLWDLLQVASPLGEALDPLRLDPPPRWERMPSVLRFAPLCRLVAGYVLSLGLASAGEALAIAFLRHATVRDSDPAVQRIANTDAIRFFAHLYWLHHMAGVRSEPGPALCALLVSALDADRSLVFPPDVRADVGLGADLMQRIRALRVRVPAGESQYLNVTRALCREAAGSPDLFPQAMPTVSA